MDDDRQLDLLGGDSRQRSLFDRGDADGGGQDAERQDADGGGPDAERQDAERQDAEGGGPGAEGGGPDAAVRGQDAERQVAEGRGQDAVGGGQDAAAPAPVSVSESESESESESVPDPVTEPVTDPVTAPVTASEPAPVTESNSNTGSGKGTGKGKGGGASPVGDAPPGALTSASHPIRVGWIPTPTPGRLGLSYCPGRRDTSTYTGARWWRDSNADMQRVRSEYDVAVLRVLAGEGELAEIGAGELLAAADAAGVRAHEHPLDADHALDAEAFAACVNACVEDLEAGACILLASRGGQGRTGAVAAAILVALGASASEAVATMRELRGPHCVHSRGEVAVETFAATDTRAGDVRFDFGHESDAPVGETTAVDVPSEVEWPLKAGSDSGGEEKPVRVTMPAPAPVTASAQVTATALVSATAPVSASATALGSRTGSGTETEPGTGTGKGLGVDSGFLDSIAIDARPASQPPKPKPDATSRRSPHADRVLGAVLGAAIGDAVGHPTEFVSSFEGIYAKWPPRGVEGFELWWNRDGKRFAPYTDDTQMAEAVLRALLEGRDGDWGLDATMQRMAERFVAWSTDPQGGHRAPGNACLSGCRALAQGSPWRTAGGPTAGGCGSVMRAYPFGLVFASDLKRAERWAVAHSALTHRDPIALAASAAMAVGVALAMRGEAPRVVLSEMVAAACRYSARTAAMMANAIEAVDVGTPKEEVLQELQGWAAHEAIAAACFLFARNPDDPRAAILEGANTPGDSDSLATLAGALCGARCGASALPAEWVRDVERSDELQKLAEEVCR